MIKGGYVLQPRIIQESDISACPPYIREVWSYLVINATKKPWRSRGHDLKSGQLFRTYKEIIDDLSWYVGFRKESYNENHMKKAMTFLRKTQRIATTKELGGVLITICNYDYYQNPDNYERTNERTNEGTTKEPKENQGGTTINNKKIKNRQEYKEDISLRKENFKNEIWKFECEYDEEHLQTFFDYWTEETHDKLFMQFEGEEYWNTPNRLKRWKPIDN